MTPLTSLARRIVGACLPVSLCAVAAVSPSPASAEAPSPCGPIYIKHYGPYDYRTQRDKLAVVDKFHFTPKVEALLSGESTAFVGGDINYTLLASPNHHRALLAMARLAQKLNQPQPPGADYSITCYFDRAIRYAPTDHIVRALFADFLNRAGRRDDALKQLDVATTTLGDDGFSHYNLGLRYFELKAYDKALAAAWRARELGFERPDLEDLLKRAGQWKAPPPAAAASAAGPASAPTTAPTTAPTSAPAPAR